MVEVPVINCRSKQEIDEQLAKERATKRAAERQALRESLPPAQTSSAELIRELRDECG